MHALGRSVAYYDMPAVRGIVRESARNNYTFSSMILAIVKSAPFQMRQVPGEDLTNWNSSDVRTREIQ